MRGASKIRAVLELKMRPQFSRFSEAIESVVFLTYPNAADSMARLKGWLAIAKLKPLSLSISLLLMLRKVFDNVEIGK